ncbi:MAG: hypothetical protein LBT38_06270, partial [Deltaproteobacteria bacterium]|nr:hypothetical protein [Deltaproteobacteria bacterium]
MTIFLTNGFQWYQAADPDLSLDKIYVGFDLKKIIEKKDLASFELFWRFFRAENFVWPEVQPEPRNQAKNLSKTKSLKNNAPGSKGEFLAFEAIGQALYEANGSLSDFESLNFIFENSLRFHFRLTFIFYFELSHWEDLSPHYLNFALRTIKNRLKPSSATGEGWLTLKKLGQFLRSSLPSLGLKFLIDDFFDSDKNPFLARDDLFSDARLFFILENLTQLLEPELATDPGLDSALDPALNPENDFAETPLDRLTSIFEGLSDFEFRLADSDLFYAVGLNQKDIIAGFFDIDEIQNLGSRLRVKKEIKKGALYLVNARDNRKMSGSYFTPTALASPLVTTGLDKRLAGLGPHDSILDLKILDPACGGGRLLKVALNALTRNAQTRLALAEDPKLQSHFAQEKRSLKATRAALGRDLPAHDLHIHMDPSREDELILKRLLLAQTIYGVDLSPLAVELTKLSLATDTYIYGAPSLALDKRIKCGHSLMGADLDLDSSVDSSRGGARNDLFANDWSALLSEVTPNISPNLPPRHRLAEPNSASKDARKDMSITKTKELNYHLNFINYLDISRVKNVKPQPPILALLKAQRVGTISRAQEAELKAWAEEAE